MKHVGTGFGEKHVKMGYILGLRVSRKHRRMGIGLKLVKSIEGWAITNGAQYIWVATEEDNVAATNLFVLKCNYVKLSSLVILVQPISSHVKDSPGDVTIEKLSIDQAISLYKDRLGSKGFYPVDMDAILKEKRSLGTWVSFFNEEDWVGLRSKESSEDFTSRTPSSWAILSIWNTSEAYKLQIRRPYPFRCLHATLSQARAKVFPCLRISFCDLLHKPFGFLFLYGIHGEGERLGELMKSLWCFASNMAGSMKDCKVIITELGNCDTLVGHVPRGASMSSINDVWYLKRVNDPSEEDDQWTTTQPSGHLFVDPRDF
ncbi:PREDICTED: probable N-acetyltransferase HLS1-like isoform X2 [Nelumbo nucifera]|nr:PREDICTED: probable N-acetyltransferase HLS1-like isoform X2 [Nelumbo nucifera]XP_010259272.1 PREDICTED: probable N-acetyltransferase HLS1-like isoform X2 [Nelumbo nucifera]